MLRNRISGDPYHLIRVIPAKGSTYLLWSGGAPERYCF